MTDLRRSLRVGMVCPYSFDVPGGVQNHVLGLARYLRQAGHRPCVLAPGELGPAAAAFDIEDFASAGAAMPLPYNGSVARVNFGPLSAARVRRWLRDGEFDLIHIHEPITPSISLLALWAAEEPVVATFHTATPRSRSMQLAGGVLRAAIEKIDAGIAVSESARNVVVQHLGRDAVVIPNGIWFDDFTKPQTTGLRPSEQPRLIFLGRLDEPRKGLDVLLAAVQLIRRARPNLEVIVAGQGSRTLPPWCPNLGTITDEAKIALLGSADVFVAPQLARESFGIVLLEAMASGVQVVASDLAFICRPARCAAGRTATWRSVRGGRPSGACPCSAAGPRPPRHTAGGQGATGSQELRLVECRHDRSCRLSGGPFRSALCTDRNRIG